MNGLISNTTFNSSVYLTHCWVLISTPVYGDFIQTRQVYECMHCGKITDSLLGTGPSIGPCKQLDYIDRRLS